MSLNMKALREKLNSLTKKSQVSENLFKPTEGTTRIRILPSKRNPEYPFLELYFHYLGGKTYLSPRSFGEADPIEEFAQSLIDEGGGKLSKEEYKAAMQFKAKLRTYAYVIDRDKEKEGPKLWGFGKTVYTDLMTTIADPDYGDITDLENGRDVKLTFTPAEKSDTKFAKTSLKILPTTSAATNDNALLKKWMDEQPAIEDVFTTATYKELQEALQRFLDVAPAETAEEEVEETSAEEVAIATAVRAEKTKKIDKDFESVFEDD